MIDVHVHVGQFKDELYFSPEQVSQDMKALNVERYYFSSTSTGNVPFKCIRREIEELITFSEGRAVPFLWVSPGMLRRSNDLKFYFFRDFAGIKLHGRFHGWEPYGRPIRRVLGIARDRNLPVMLHTGGDTPCDAGAYMKLCLEFSDVKIILAHGRPVDQAIDVMHECPNAWADTAFMPTEDILKLKEAGLSSRVLWGSDLPVMKYFYKNTPVTKYYRDTVNEVKERLGNEIFQQISFKNFIDFGL